MLRTIQRWVLRWEGLRLRPHAREVALIGAFLLAVVLVAGVTSTFWLGYRATRESERSAEQTVAARAKEVLALLAVAIEQDMKGGQLRLLVPFNQEVLERSSLYDIADRCAAAFARFPYIESVYVWGRKDGHTYLFSRSERMPPWNAVPPKGASYPVVVQTDPEPPSALIEATRRGSEDAPPYVLVEGVINGAAYQTVAHRSYADDGRLTALVGFTVNVDWVRHHYFADLLQQVQRITGDAMVRFEVVDDRGRTVASAGPDVAATTRVERPFLFAFSDRALAHATDDGPLQSWIVRVDTAPGETVILSRHGYQRTLVMLSVGAATAIVALLLTASAIRASADLASRQSEFVSAVSHEMKTPLSLITLASDSLAAGRCDSPEGIREYGRLLSGEARQLASLIDNVLCYARLVNDTDTVSYEPVDLAELVTGAVERFRMRCAETACDVRVEAAPRLPLVRGDRRMLQSVVDNIVDNAIKYGAAGGLIEVALGSEANQLRLAVADHGAGIPEAELSRVFEKFHRGSEAARRFRGSGLGLTIAERIVTSHGGRIDIRSRVGHGTTVTVRLPIARST